MKGNKLIAVLMVVFIADMHVNKVTAKNLRSVEKNDSVANQFPMYGELYTCGEQCDPNNHQCPIECLTNIAMKDEKAFIQFLRESQVGVRGLFCVVGCAATNACPKLDPSGEFSLSLINLFTN